MLDELRAFLTDPADEEDGFVRIDSVSFVEGGAFFVAERFEETRRPATAA